MGGLESFWNDSDNGTNQNQRILFFELRRSKLNRPRPTFFWLYPLNEVIIVGVLDRNLIVRDLVTSTIPWKPIQMIYQAA